MASGVSDESVDTEFEDGETLLSSEVTQETIVDHLWSSLVPTLTLKHMWNMVRLKLLPESLKPDTLSAMLLTCDDRLLTVLHLAVMEDNKEMVEYLCNQSLPNNNLLLCKDKSSRTALHYVSSKEVAQVLVESNYPVDMEKFVLHPNSIGRTALHEAVERNNIDVIKYLCNLPFACNMLMIKDQFGKTALHCAQTREGVKLLLKLVHRKSRTSYLLSTTSKKDTVLHLAASAGLTDLVEFYCSEELLKELVTETVQTASALNGDSPKILTTCIDDENKTAAIGRETFLKKILLAKNETDATALHYASNKAIARQLVEAVGYDEQKSFILAGDNNHSTALHCAVMGNRTDVVEYLCAFPLDNNELVFKRDIDNRTVLHIVLSEQVAKIIISSVGSDSLKEFLLTADSDGNTVLHFAAVIGRVDVIKYLCSIELHSNELLWAQTLRGYTFLHIAYSEEVVNAVFTTKASSWIKQISAIEDNDGNTAILSLVIFGRFEALAALLENLQELYHPKTFAILMGKQNKYRQNVLHLAALSLVLDELYDVLQDYLPHMNVTEMMASDVYGNTPVHYAAAKYHTRVFADFMLHLPLSARRLTANATNIQLTNCRILVAKELFEETYYIQKVLCANNTPSLASMFPKLQFYFSSRVRNFEQKLANPDKYFSYDEKMFKVLKYSLNEYSLLDTAYRLSPTFTSSDVSKLQSNQSLSDTNSATNDCLSIIIDCADVVDSQRTVQEALNNMDEEVYNGKPKVLKNGSRTI